MTDPLRLRFRYSEDDYVRGVRLHLARRMHLRLDVTVAGLAAVASVVMLAFEVGYPWVWGALLAVAVVLLAMVFVAYFFIPRRQFRSQPKLHDEYALTFTEADIEFRSAGIDSRLKWELYDRAVADEHSYLLYYGRDAYTVIPRSAFASAADESRFRELLRQRLPASVL